MSNIVPMNGNRYLVPKRKTMNSIVMIDLTCDPPKRVYDEEIPNGEYREILWLDLAQLLECSGLSKDITHVFVTERGISFRRKSGGLK